MRLAIWLLVASACHAPAPVAPTAAVGGELDAFVRAYMSALSARDVPRTLAFYEPGLALLGTNDGVAYSSDATFAAIKGFIAATRSITIQLDTVTPRPITADLGIVWVTSHESWVDAAGAPGKIEVQVSWIVQRTDGRWHFIYYDGQHIEQPNAG